MLSDTSLGAEDAAVGRFSATLERQRPERAGAAIVVAMIFGEIHPLMDRYLTEEHVALRTRVNEFAREAIEPVARELDETGEFPWENVKSMADMGLFGVPVPKSLGGMGHDYLSYILVIEELAKFDASHSITVSAHTTLGMSPILSFGSEEQKRRFVPPLASGEVIGGFGLTEPGAGSDASGTRTRAVREDGGCLIAVGLSVSVAVYDELNDSRNGCQYSTWVVHRPYCEGWKCLVGREPSVVVHQNHRQRYCGARRDSARFRRIQNGPRNEPLQAFAWPCGTGLGSGADAIRKVRCDAEPAQICGVAVDTVQPSQPGCVGQVFGVRIGATKRQGGEVDAESGYARGRVQ